MSRRNDLWIMNSLAFDNVIAINERTVVADSLFQVDANSTRSEGNNTEKIDKSDIDAILEQENVDNGKTSNVTGG